MMPFGWVVGGLCYLFAPIKTNIEMFKDTEVMGPLKTIAGNLLAIVLTYLIAVKCSGYEGGINWQIALACIIIGEQLFGLLGGLIYYYVKDNVRFKKM